MLTLRDILFGQTSVVLSPKLHVSEGLVRRVRMWLNGHPNGRRPTNDFLARVYAYSNDLDIDAALRQRDAASEPGQVRLTGLVVRDMARSRYAMITAGTSPPRPPSLSAEREREAPVGGAPKGEKRGPKSPQRGATKGPQGCGKPVDHAGDKLLTPATQPVENPVDQALERVTAELYDDVRPWLTKIQRDRSLIPPRQPVVAGWRSLVELVEHFNRVVVANYSVPVVRQALAEVVVRPERFTMGSWGPVTFLANRCPDVQARLHSGAVA